MISKTSSKNWIIYKGALKRLKWLGILYGVALFLQAPLLIWMELGKQKSIQGILWAEVANKTNWLQMLFHPFEHFTNILVSVVFGLILFYYLQNDRASAFFHSLPIKRGSLYWQNLLAGLTLIWLPILINGAFIYGVLNLFGVTEGQFMNYQVYSPGMELVNQNDTNIVSVWQALGYWLFLSLLMTALFLIFTVFVGMFTGNVLLQGVLTFIGLVLPLGLYMLVNYNLWRLLYGFPRNFDSGNIERLSPLISYLYDRNYHRLLSEGLTWYLWYLAAAVIICGASVYLYKKRHVEAAGETLAAGWIRWIFKYGVAICAALTGGVYFSTLNEDSLGVLYLGYFIGGVLGYVIADMVAYKSFHFYRRWKGMLVIAAAFILLLSTVKLDVFGYEAYIPEQDKIKAVSVSAFNREGPMAEDGFTGKDTIEKVRLLHRQIIKMEKENETLKRSLNKRQTETAGSVSPLPPTRNVSMIDITYNLNSGAQVKRTYTIDLSRYRQYLVPIFESPEVKKSIYGRFFKLDRKKIDQININNHHLGKNVRIYKPEEIDEALKALRKDVLNVSYESAVEGKAPTMAVLEFMSKPDANRNYDVYNLSYLPEFKNFEAFLEKHGYDKELFLNPSDVSEILVKKVGTEEITKITEKEDIEQLLNWCSLTDERYYSMRQEKLEDTNIVEYSGKVILKKGSPLFVIFESSPYALQVINEIVNKQ